MAAKADNPQRNTIMPKMKTKKAATKKFKLSATGKAMRTQKRHLNGYKTRARKRNLRGATAVYEGNQKMVARMLQA